MSPSPVTELACRLCCRRRMFAPAWPNHSAENLCGAPRTPSRDYPPVAFGTKPRVIHRPTDGATRVRVFLLDLHPPPLDSVFATGSRGFSARLRHSILKDPSHRPSALHHDRG